jgi:thioredoxin-dependent peroxiredoxin
MTERKGIMTFKGTPLTLIGPALKVGDRAPDAKLVANDWSEVSLSSYRGKVIILSVVQSLDTSVCDIQTRKFNEEAGALGPDVVVVTVSMDLPPAQKRWCGASGLKNVVTLSDHKEGAFGRAYGVLIKELRLDGRSVFAVDRQGVIRYIQILSEGTHEPEYAPALEAVRKLL